MEIFSGGNRSASVWMAMDRMGTAGRAQLLRSIQSYGANHSFDLRISPSEISDPVKRVLAPQTEV